ncbi:MAG: hypothetical protein E7214_15055 [Clostridium sp.]|nr:hypothetical protein [Clostridium sp.]
MNIIFSIIMLSIGTVILGNTLEFKAICESQFNVITINTVIIGFLFTSLSFLLGFLKEDLIDYLEDMNCMENVYKKIESGIGLACFTIGLCFFNLLFINETPNIGDCKNYLLAAEVSLVILLFINFIIALINVKIVINEIRKKRKQKRNEEKANNKYH